MNVPQPGDEVGNYVLERLIAQGGMGAVYAAQHRSLPRQVALKLILGLPDPDLRARFLREIEASGRLDHPNLVRVHDSGESEGRLYLAMEFVRGESLQARLDRRGPLAPREAVGVLLEAAAGIAFAHAAGVLHRDLKPANLLHDEVAGTTRVVDFGLTGRLQGAESLTVTGEVLGTPGFMAPEQAGSAPTDERTDVYGLGATLFALVSGRAPFLGKGLAALAAVFEEPPPDLRGLCAEVDAGLAGIVARCLRKDPSERYASVPALQTALSAWLAGEAPDLGRGRARGWVKLGAGLGLCLLLAGGSAGAVQLRRAQQRAQAQEVLGEFAAWRERRLEPFACGFGPSDAALAEELEGWSSRLAGVAGFAAPEPWAAAASEVRAARRILGARAGQDPGPPGAGAYPSPGDIDGIAQAAIRLERGDARGAAEALRVVGGLAKTQLAYRACVLGIEAKLEPTLLLRRLEREGHRDLPLVVGHFPAALKLAATGADPGDLVRWTALAKRVGVREPERALCEALEASAGRWERELDAREAGAGEAALIGMLCRPLRAEGLWPGPGFATACREHFAATVGPALARSHDPLRWLSYEHELCYRVDGRTSDLPGWGQALRVVVSPPTPGLIRAWARIGSFPGGLNSDERFQTLQQALAREPEPESRMEGLVQWYLEFVRAMANKDYTQREEIRARLKAALSFGIDDVHPVCLIRCLSVYVGYSHWPGLVQVPDGLSADDEFAVARLDVAARDSLARQLRDPDADNLEMWSVALTSICVSSFVRGSPERALAQAQAGVDDLGQLRRAGSGHELLQEIALRVEAQVYGSTAALCLSANQAVAGLPMLEPKREFVRAQGEPRARAGYLGWLVVAVRERDGLASALQVVRSSSGAEREWDSLALPASRVLEEAGELEEAADWIERSMEWLRARLDPKPVSADPKFALLEARLAELRQRARRPR